MNSALCPLSGAEFRRRRQQLLWDGQEEAERRRKSLPLPELGAEIVGC